MGVLQGICNSTAGVDKVGGWSMLVGTSIGALISGMLAQFPPALQCAQGVPEVRQFWSEIRSQKDVFQSSELGSP